MFETLDVMLSLAVIFLIFSMIHKYIMSFFKRALGINAKVIAEEMKTFVGEETSKYMLAFLDDHSRHLNFLDKTKKGEKRLRRLSTEEMKGAGKELAILLEEKKDDLKGLGAALGLTDVTEEKYKIVTKQLRKVENKVENVYDSTLLKISERVKNRMRICTLIFGIILAFGINADFFDIYASISRHAPLRDDLVARGTVTLEDFTRKIDRQEALEGSEEVGPTKLLEEIRSKLAPLSDEIQRTGLELGWTEKAYEDLKSGDKRFINKFIGLLISGLLISFGAPFWHDLLSALMGVKNVLRKKERA